MKTLVTGAAGFIGFHVAQRLIERGDIVVGLDLVNNYYDPALKEARLSRLVALGEDQGASYRFIRGDLSAPNLVSSVVKEEGIQRVIHLAAQAGVRYSLEDPHSYVQSNIVGFANVLEACRDNKVGHLTYASTSSVYGANTALPSSEEHGVDHPLQFYAATKRANELMAHSYSHLFRLPTTALRFFTVYGPWGRPDMALFKFTRAILAGKPITVFNHGNHSRDFTYIDDIAEGVIRASDIPATANPDFDPARPRTDVSNAPFRIFNIGNGQPVKLITYINALEAALGRKADLELLPLQPGDVPDTFADTSALKKAMGYRPSTSIDVGVARFVGWYRSYYNV